MSKVRRLRTSDRIFFVIVNPRRHAEPLGAAEDPVLIDALERSRRRLEAVAKPPHEGVVSGHGRSHALIRVA